MIHSLLVIYFDHVTISVLVSGISGKISNLSLSPGPSLLRVTNLITAAMETNHREHTLLLNRKRVNKERKRTNSLPLSPVVLTRPYCRENRYLQVLAL